MEKKFDTLMRQWKMLQLLSPRTRIGTKQVQEELQVQGYEVDIRTIQRDLKNLSRVFPIVCDERKPMGWGWAKDGASFDVPGMDTTAALTLKMAEDYLGSLLPKSCIDSLSPHMRRAKEILDGIGEKRLARWPEKVRVLSRQQPLHPPEMESEILDTISEALLSDVQFVGTYRKRGTEDAQEYTVNPLGLVSTDPVLYLVATLWDYEDIRLFAIHRFESAEMTETPVRKPAGFSLDGYINSGALGFPVQENKKIYLVMEMDKSIATHLHESPLAEGQEIFDCGNEKVMVQAEVLDTQQLRWWLLGFGSRVEILEPLGFRKEFARISREMAQQYS